MKITLPLSFLLCLPVMAMADESSSNANAELRRAVGTGAGQRQFSKFDEDGKTNRRRRAAKAAKADDSDSDDERRLGAKSAKAQDELRRALQDQAIHAEVGEGSSSNNNSDRRLPENSSSAKSSSSYVNGRVRHLKNPVVSSESDATGKSGKTSSSEGTDTEAPVNFQRLGKVAGVPVPVPVPGVQEADNLVVAASSAEAKLRRALQDQVVDTEASGKSSYGRLRRLAPAEDDDTTATGKSSKSDRRLGKSTKTTRCTYRRSRGRLLSPCYDD